MNVSLGKNFRFSVILFCAVLLCANSVYAAEVINAKTEKTVVAEDAGYVLFSQGALPDTENDNKDGMHIKNPFEACSKFFKRKELKRNNSGETRAEEEQGESIKVQPTKDESEISLDSDEMEYSSITNEVEARGNVVITTKPDNVKITAKRGTYNRTTNIIKLYDNVTVCKDGAEISGDYLIVDLNEENILMNEPVGRFSNFKITGREGYAYANKIETINGEISLTQQMDTSFATTGFLNLYDNTIFDRSLATSEMKKKRLEPYTIQTKEIYIKSDKDHDVVTVKNAQISYKNRKVLAARTVQIYTDKEHSYMETNMPEIGSMRDFGTYFGPGFVTKAPFGSTLKLTPIIAIDDGVGVGVWGRIKSKRHLAEAGWASNNKNLIVRGKYNFNDDFKLEYSRHGWMDEWFYGGRQPGYLLQLVHDKKWDVRDLDATYRQRFTAGYVSEYSKDDQKDMDGTARIRWQAELTKRFFTVGNREQEMFLDFGAYTQTGATVYGSGETTAVVRVGPYIQSRVKNWGSRIYYAIAGVHGLSPYLFDQYRYGKSSITIDQNYRLNKYIAAGYTGTFTPLKDNPEEDLVAENRFYVMVGPEDFKVAVSYDSVREAAAVNVMFLLGSDNFRAKYEKLTIENIETLGKKRDIFEDIKLGRVKVPELEPQTGAKKDVEAEIKDAEML